MAVLLAEVRVLSAPPTSLPRLRLCLLSSFASVHPAITSAQDLDISGSEMV